MHSCSLAQKAVYLSLQAQVLLLPGLHLGARLFSVQIRDMSLPQVFLNSVLDGGIVLVGIQKPERVCASAHVAAIRELEHVILEGLHDVLSQQKKINMPPEQPACGARQHPGT